MTSRRAASALALSMLAAATVGSLASCGEGGTKATSAGSGGSAGSAGSAGSGGGDDSFIAFESDFTGYQTWKSYPLGVLPMTFSNEPAEGPVTLYVNQLPKHGATEFPVGTIIVKTIQVGTPDQWTIFAMVKRGGDFNFEGALNWEWFDLTQDASYAPTIQWRGATPPSGMGYGGLGMGGICNDCHGDAASNDYVQGTALLLSSF